MICRMDDYVCLRGGLGHAGRKLSGGGAFTVAYLGGSITWGAHASDLSRLSYRARNTAWLRERYPAAQVDEVNAGIGGTSSTLGAFRVQAHVLDLNPDLVLVEFAVNDTGRPRARVVRAMESIIRQCLRHSAQPDVCLVYTLSRAHLPALRSGLPETMRYHEDVASHYGLPSVNLAREVARQLDQGSVKWEALFADEVHPSDKGHELYSEALAAGLAKLLPVPPQRPALPEPLGAAPWENGMLVPVGPWAGRFADWQYRPMQNKGGWECFDGLLESQTPGAEAVFEFNGPVIGLVYHLGPETGDMFYAIDDAPMSPLRVFDSYAPQFWRPHYQVLAEDLLPGPHRLRVAVSPEKDPASTGHWTKLGYLMCTG